MKTFDPGCCDVSPSEFGSLVDLILTSATAVPVTPSPYPIEFGNPPRIFLEVENEFHTLHDWRGRVLTTSIVEEDTE